MLNQAFTFIQKLWKFYRKGLLNYLPAIASPMNKSCGDFLFPLHSVGVCLIIFGPHERADTKFFFSDGSLCWATAKASWARPKESIRQMEVCSFSLNTCPNPQPCRVQPPSTDRALQAWKQEARIKTAAAAAAKSLQSCPTLCDPIDGSPPGSPVPGILQARTLQWVAISFSRAI